MKILNGLFLVATRKNIQNQCLIDFEKIMNVESQGRVNRNGVCVEKESRRRWISSVGGQE
jgi:hypothetical protein